MFSNGFPEFNINDLTAFDDNSYCGYDFGFNGFNWENSSDFAGPSQPYTEAEVRGDLSTYPDFPSPCSAPTSLDPTHGALPNEGYNSPFYQGSTMPSFSPQQVTITPEPPFFSAPSPVPTLLRGSSSLSPEPYAAPITPAHRWHAQSQVISNSDGLGFGFPTVAESSSLPAVHPSPPYIPSYGELWGECPQSDPLRLDIPIFHPATGATSPECHLPAPVASSSGPKRTRQSVREARRYDPMKPAREKADSKKDSWNQTLVRFRAEFDAEYGVLDGQPSGGLVPATALARLSNFVKEDLKRSPLRNTRAGEGKRSRDVEDYLKGLLKAIRPVEPTPIPTGGESNEDDTTVAALSRLADELEAKLAAVNQQPALRRPPGTSQPGRVMCGERMGKYARKNGTEKERRDWERHHLERISRLFKATRQLWSKKEVLSLAVLFLLYGPAAFPPDFLEAHLTTSGL